MPEMERKLHVGCGKHLLGGWINADRDPVEGAIYLDASRPLPFSDSNFDYIFSEHFIEHLEYEAGAQYLRECFRILRPGGIVRTATPDLRFVFDLYPEPKSATHRAYVDWIARHHVPYGAEPTAAFVVNNFFHGHGHRFIHDVQTLTTLLERAGFLEVERCALGKSRHEALRGIEGHGAELPEGFNELEAFVLEATKPGAPQ